MNFLASAWAFLKGVPSWLYGALGIALAFLAAYWRGKRAGRASERQKANEEAWERKEETEQREREIEGLPDDELEERGKPWLRK